MRVSSALLLLSALWVATAAANANPPEGIAMAMGIETPIQMYVGAGQDATSTQDASTVYQFTNLTDASVTLSAPDGCQAVTWTVTDPSGAVVEQSPACTAPGAPDSIVVPAGGKPVQRQSTVALHVLDYKENTTYTFHYAAFGLQSSATFTVTYLQ